MPLLIEDDAEGGHVDAQLAANMLGLLLDGLQGPAPGFAHMLLGFNLQQGPSPETLRICWLAPAAAL